MTTALRLPLSAILLSVGTYFGFSTFDSFCRMTMLAGAPQTQVLALAYATALIPACMFIHLQKEWGALRPTRPGLVALRAGLSVVELSCVFYTLRHLSLAESYTLFFTLPLWAAFLGAVFLGEQLRKRQIRGIGLGFLGVLVAMQPTPDTITGAHVTGLVAGVLGGGAVVLMRQLGKTERAGSIFLILFLTLSLANASLTTVWVPLTSLQCLQVLLAGLSIGLAQICFYAAIRRVPAPLFAPFQYTQILWMMLYGTLLFHEPIHPGVLAGLALVSLGGWMLVAKPAAPPSLRTEETPTA